MTASWTVPDNPFPSHERSGETRIEKTLPAHDLPRIMRREIGRLKRRPFHVRFGLG